MLPYQFIGKWDYTNPEANVKAVNIPMTDRPDWIYVKNLTNWGDGSTQAAIESEWYSSMAQGSYIQMGQGGGSGGNYGYVYTLTQPATVAVQTPVLWFDAIGPANGVSVAAGTGNITIANAGTYKIEFSVSGTEPNQFAIFVNGVAQTNAIYGSGAGTQQNTGFVIVTVPASAVITLVNHTSTGNTAITLAPNVGGTENQVMASVTINQLASSGSVLSNSKGTSGGFTFIDQTKPPVYAKVAITAIDGTTGVVLTANTAGISVGDLIRLINVTGALELSSMLFQVTAVSAGVSITFGNFATAATAGFSVVNGTTGFYQKMYPGFMYPHVNDVIGITQAVQAKVYFARKNDFTVGELVDFNIPVAYGMNQLSFLTGRSAETSSLNPPGAPRVLQVINSATESSIVLDYDTTGFTAFALPTSANYLGGVNGSPATCFPAGSGVVPFGASATVIGSATIPQSPPGYNLLDASDNRAQYVMNLGINVVGAANAHMVVMAFKADTNNQINNA